MNFDINRPWLSLDPWQKEYIETPLEIDCHLLTPRQAGKTTAMSIKAVELSVHHLKEGEVILISSLTERQAMLMLKKAQIYAESKYNNLICKDRENKPTMHRLMFKSGKLNKGILCYAAGEEGDSTRGYTLKKLMCDEGSRMKEEYFISALPTLSITKGSMDIASTPCGKINKFGEENFFFKCWKDPNFKKFAVNIEDVPRYNKEFLEKMKSRMSKLQYAQEYQGIFTDELKRLFDDELIEEICCLKREEVRALRGDNYLGIDVAGFGKDEITFCELAILNNNLIFQKEQIIKRKKRTTETTKQAIYLDMIYNNKKIGVDDGGIGFGVFSELIDDNRTKRKTIALNNASRIKEKTRDGDKNTKLLKEEMYINLLSLMENKRIKLLNDDEIKASLSSIQEEEGKIFGSYSHIVESIIRAAWLASKDKHLNIFMYPF